MVMDVAFVTYLHTNNEYFVYCMAAVAAVVGWLVW
jgi:hypothetical protein